MWRPRRPEGFRRLKLRQSTFNLWNQPKKRELPRVELRINMYSNWQQFGLHLALSTHENRWYTFFRVLCEQGDGSYFRKTTVNNTPIPPTVDRYTTYSQSKHNGRGAGRVPTHIPTDLSTDSRPTCRRSISRYVDRHIGRYSVDMSADCPSTYRPREIFITHDPKHEHI